MTAFVLEDLKNRQIRFLRAIITEKKGKKLLKLLQLGIMTSKPSLMSSPLIKYRSVAKVDPMTGQHYQVGLVLRENGRFEVYSDFMLTHEY